MSNDGGVREEEELLVSRHDEEMEHDSTVQVQTKNRAQEGVEEE